VISPRCGSRALTASEITRKPSQRQPGRSAPSSSSAEAAAAAAAEAAEAAAAAQGHRPADTVRDTHVFTVRQAWPQHRVAIPCCCGSSAVAAARPRPDKSGAPLSQALVPAIRARAAHGAAGCHLRRRAAGHPAHIYRRHSPPSSAPPLPKHVSHCRACLRANDVTATGD
jgi:hypothetical protein